MGREGTDENFSRTKWLNGLLHPTLAIHYVRLSVVPSQDNIYSFDPVLDGYYIIYTRLWYVHNSGEIVDETIRIYSYMKVCIWRSTRRTMAVVHRLTAYTDTAESRWQLFPLASASKTVRAANTWVHLYSSKEWTVKSNYVDSAVSIFIIWVLKLLGE